MKRQKPSNLSSSVHQRLLNLRDESNQGFNLLLTRYALERLLYRISKSEYANQFILKGALLFVVWKWGSYRPTQDMDLLGYGGSSFGSVKDLFQKICLVDVEPDGLQFDSESITVKEIRENQEYESQRIHMVANLGNARIKLQIDMGFGDVITPSAQVIDYPVLLDFPKPHIRVYPPETVIAEKLQAMVILGMQNSRMKDYYDLWQLAQHFTFEGNTLTVAISATFSHRQTDIPTDFPVGLTDVFAEDVQKTTQWQAFLSRISVDNRTKFKEIVDDLRAFLGPPLFAARRNESLQKSWNDGGPWIMHKV